MNHKTYAYTGMDGNHFPDCYLGSEEFYSIDFSDFLNIENETLVEVEWIIPEYVNASEDFHSGTEAYVKLSPQKRGTHTIKCKISLTETDINGIVRDQQKLVVMQLKVN
tara:strand:- start:3000 stop:3326 length:327 start_codon:yes stop_codon:yes gene_type:complete